MFDKVLNMPPKTTGFCSLVQQINVQSQQDRYQHKRTFTKFNNNNTRNKRYTKRQKKMLRHC